MGKASLYKFAIFFDSKFLTIYDVDVDDDVGSNDGGGDATVDIIWCRPPPLPLSSEKVKSWSLKGRDEG